MIDFDSSRSTKIHWKPTIEDPLFFIYKGIKNAISSDYQWVCIDNNDEIVKRILGVHASSNKGKKFYIFCSSTDDWKLLTEQYHVLIHKEKVVNSFYINHPIHIMNLDIYGLNPQEGGHDSPSFSPQVRSAKHTKCQGLC